MYLIIKRIKYESDKDLCAVVNSECFGSLDSANSYAMHLGNSEKRKNVTYTVIKLGE